MHTTFQSREGERFRVQISHSLRSTDGQSPGYNLIDFSVWSGVTPTNQTGHIIGSVGIYVESVEHLDRIIERAIALRRVMVEGVEVIGESGQYRREKTYREAERVPTDAEIRDALDFGKTVDQHLGGGVPQYDDGRRGGEAGGA